MMKFPILAFSALHGGTFCYRCLQNPPLYYFEHCIFSFAFRHRYLLNATLSTPFPCGKYSKLHIAVQYILLVFAGDLDSNSI